MRPHEAAPALLPRPQKAQSARGEIFKRELGGAPLLLPPSASVSASVPVVSRRRLRVALGGLAFRQNLGQRH
eukprot:scaffold2795_cov428-Pinguiococcus_pyrenoidosus.AAC.1